MSAQSILCSSNRAAKLQDPMVENVRMIKQQQMYDIFGLPANIRVMPSAENHLDIRPRSRFRQQAEPPTEKSGPGAMLRGLIKRITSPARSRSHNRLDTSEGAVSTVHRDDDTGDEG